MHCHDCPPIHAANDPHHLCGHVDVAIITIIEIEKDAAIHILDLKDKKLHRLSNGHAFHYGTIKADGGSELRVAVFCAGSQGNPAAAVIASIIQMSLLPRLSVLLGISAGYQIKVNIGDVLVPTQIVDFSFVVAKDEEDFNIELPRDKHKYIDGFVATTLNRIISSKRLSDALSRRDAYMDSHNKIWKNDFDGKSVVKDINSNPVPFSAHRCSIKVHDGILASSNVLLRNGDILSKLSGSRYDQLVGADMEAAGFSEACTRLGANWLVVRSVTDFGDSNKKNDFHRYASANAGAYLYALLFNNGNSDLLRQHPSPADEFIRSKRMALERKVVSLLEATASAFQINLNIAVNIGVYWRCFAVCVDRFGSQILNGGQPKLREGVARNGNMRVFRRGGIDEVMKFFPFQEKDGGAVKLVAECVKNSHDETFGLGAERVVNCKPEWVRVFVIKNHMGKKVGALCCTGEGELKGENEDKIRSMLKNLSKWINSAIASVDESFYTVNGVTFRDDGDNEKQN